MHTLLAVALATLSLLSLTLAQNSMSLRMHSIAMPYIDDNLQNRWFDFGGDTIINTNRHIRLTSNKQSQQGYLWSRLPLAAINFEIEFEFKVHGQSGHLYGDGFAMWLTKERATIGNVFGSTNQFTGLGIFFDTYDNERAHRHTFPYISSMLGNGVASYNNDKDGHPSELAGCEANFRAKEFPTRAKLTYYRDNYLQLDVSWRAENEWDTCFKVYDIVRLPEQIYLGFSAHTGEVTDNHDIISVSTKALSTKEREKEIELLKFRPKSAKRSGGFLSFLFKMAMAGALVGTLFVAYRLYDKNNRLKRF